MISVADAASRAAPAASSSSSAHWLPGNTFCVNLLRCAHTGAVLYRSRSHTGEHLFQRSQYPDRVQIVVIANMRNPKQLALHFGLAIGHDSSKGFAKLFDYSPGIDSGGSLNRRKRG